MDLVGAEWYYNWHHVPGVSPGLESVPMLYGASSVGEEIGGNSDYLLTFNEPENPGQANLTPEQAAEYWPDIMTLYSDKIIVSPGCYDPNWLYKFLPLVDPKPKVLAAHCYVERGQENLFSQYLYKFILMARSYGIPEVWVTEWAYVIDIEREGYQEASRFINHALAWMDTMPEITRQAYFQLSYLGTEKWCWGPTRNTSLVNYFDGWITPLGDAYREVVKGGGTGGGPGSGWLKTDINADGVIDIKDLVLVARDFGKKR